MSSNRLVTVRNYVKPIAQRVGIDGLLRQGLFRGRKIGEDIRVRLRGRPDTSSTILLSGSARSGTSWVGGLLARTGGIQILFEPLNPPTNEQVRQLTGWDAGLPVARSPYLRPDTNSPEWHALLEDVLTGKYRHYVTDFERTSYWPNRYLIKGIRFNMMLGYISDNFQPSIVHLVRHPCAVVYSRLYRERGDPWRASVQDILNQEALMEDYLLPWAGEIERETDPLGAHAVWWAVENMIAYTEMATRPHVRVHYEDLCLEPIASISHAASELKIADNYVNRLDFGANSRTAATTREQTTRARLEAWQKGFSDEDVHRILYWALELGLPWYDSGVLPRTTS